MAEEIKREETPEERAERLEEAKRVLQAKTEEIRAKTKEANEALMQGKGIFKLEKPIKSGEEEVTELAYDFTEMTGLEYTDAMDSDPNASQIFKITNRQALSLFAAAAAKQTPLLDRRDIEERIGMTDAVEVIQLATLFFSASTRAGRLRISKK